VRRREVHKPQKDDVVWGRKIYKSITYGILLFYYECMFLIFKI